MSQQINLFNPKFERQKHQISARTATQCLGLLLVGLAALSLYGQRKVAELEHQESAVKADLAQREARRDKALRDFPPRHKDPEVAQQLAAAEAQQKLLQDATGILGRGELGNAQGYASYFRALAQARVEGVWLTGLHIAGAGNDISLEGRALHASLLPAYISRLGQQDVFKGKTFASLDIGPPDGVAPGAPVTADGKGVKPAPYVVFSLQSTRADVTAASTPQTGGQR
ncbi:MULTISPECIES: PilN domain-containing protein [unclassified Janthinobacterium]|uniref:PilN domain-containing protein n=1 Tax=unclassified Janthinobacterium TaxID=2610881 RepID=UPI001607AE50|nr:MULTISPECIES: PilN domain-containing protein [unclassified Janthinobacterium]MBB5609542.1 hypothetical protein [Janthinobacterium sp. S3T4]MBB5614611.1 hypothetical protein [Janthinobacterium sp. S3M3]